MRERKGRGGFGRAFWERVEPRRSAEIERWLISDQVRERLNEALDQAPEEDRPQVQDALRRLAEMRMNYPRLLPSHIRISHNVYYDKYNHNQ
jgi:hypothetical protein